MVAAEFRNRRCVGVDLSGLAVTLCKQRLDDATAQGKLARGRLSDPIHRTDTPQRTDVGKLPPYRTHKHALFGKQEGLCAGCRMMFPFQNFEVDHVVPKSKGGTDHPDNLQLLCSACNRLKGDRPNAAFLATLDQLGCRPST